MTVTVFGSASTQPDSDDYEVARRLGRLLAESGHLVINGGQMGTMDGVARGCAEGGGRCVGITVKGAPWGPPTAHAHEIQEFDDLLLRTRELLFLADAWIALPGQVGTLAEVALAWALMGGGLMNRRPLVLLGSAWRDAVPVLAQHLQIRAELVALLEFAATPEEAVAWLGNWS